MKLTKKQEEIIEICTILFYEKGYTETAISDITEFMNIKPASIYSHIESKEQILEWICDDVHQKFRAIIPKIYESTLDDRQKQKLLSQLHLKALLSSIKKFRIYSNYWHFLNAKKQSEYSKGQADYMEMVKSIMNKIVFLDTSEYFKDSAIEDSAIQMLNSIPKMLIKEEMSQEEIEQVIDVCTDRFLFGLYGQSSI